MRRRRSAGRRPVGKTERWLNLLAFLLDRRYPVTREQILSEVEDYRTGWVGGSSTAKESVRRKFERDKRDLRALGVVIEPDRHRVSPDHTSAEVEAYLLRPRDLYLPYLELAPARSGTRRPYQLPTVSIRPEELALLRRAAERVVALGPTPLGPSAASALRKLSFDLPGIDPGEDDTAVGPAPPAGFERTFDTLRVAVEQRVAVRCRYYSIGRDQDEQRVIEPYGLMLSWGHWYCIARAPEKDAMRVFRVERMRDATPLEGEGARFLVPAEFTVQDWLDRAPWELSEAPEVPVQVRFGFPHSRWVMAEGLGRVLERMDDAGGALLEFAVRSAEPFLRWLLPFGPQAQIVQPADLAGRLRQERERVRALYF